MAKIVYTKLFADIEAEFDSQAAVLTKHTRTTAVFFDDDALSAIHLTGHDLSYKKGHLVGGTVTKIEFENQFGDNYFVLTGGKVQIHRAKDSDLDQLIQSYTKGDDKVFGSTGDDFLFGGTGNNVFSGGDGNDTLFGQGNDKYTGGAGNDLFYVGFGGGKDVITDFDADGGEGNQDFLARIRETEFRISQKGADTVVNFGQGHKVTLLGVDATLVTEADFFS